MHARPLLSILALAAASPAADRRLEAVPAGDGIRVHVAKRGLFSAFAHDHDFEVTRWRGRAEIPDGDPGRTVVELSLAADSLRDREKGLSGDDRKKVEAQTAGPEILDAAREPEITYRSDRVTLDGGGASGAKSVRGVLHGRLTLRGQTRPVDSTFEAERQGEGWLVRGTTRFRQSEFGIRPFSGAGGTVGVKDEVQVRFALTLRPGGAASDARASERR